jgi:DUF1680 family protein
MPVSRALPTALGLIACLATGSLGAQPSTPPRDQGVLFLKNSPHAKLHSVPVHAVTLRDGLWADRRKVNVEKSIPSIKELLEQHGYIDNFRRLKQKMDVPKKGPVFADTDTYKWLEAVGFALQSEDHPRLRAMAEKTIDEVVAIQEPSGYLNAHWVGDLAGRRLIPETMEFGHELYNLGHMLQGAIAYYRATGNRQLLDAGAKFADYLARDFGPGKKPLLAGHPEVEMALIELYRTTGEKRYLDLAGYLLGGDERLDRPLSRVIYTFSGTPFVDRKQLEGHSVRAMYACSGATDYYLETGDRNYWNTLERLWNDLVDGKMYITGGIGSRWTGEAFGEPYELPNGRSYAETCAAIGEMMWNWRMLAATGEARFTDVIELSLYNAINVGMSLSGTLYCYRNPLESSGVDEPNWQSDDGTVRNPWYDVLCCPPNIERTFASLPGYFYSTSSDGLYLHLFHNSDLDWHLEDGTALGVTQKTDYPWDGAVSVQVNPAEAHEFTFYLRIPGWARSAQVAVNSTAVPGAVRPGSYLPIRRTWNKGDEIRLTLPMQPQLIAANPLLRENNSRTAVRRGPLVYALEKIDQPAAVGKLSEVQLVIPKDPQAGFKIERRNDLLGGVVVLKHSAQVFTNALSSEPLYRPLSSEQRRPAQPVELTFIPYYSWANRTPSPMLVWVPYTRQN